MLTIVFIVVLSLYCIVAIKVDYWITIKLLSFPLACPEAFLRNEGPYHWAVRLLFAASAISGYFSAIPLYITIPLLVVVWISSGSIGHAKAYFKYRSELIDMAHHETDLAKKTEYIALSQKTNQQLAQEVLERVQMENQLAKYRR
jgi:hypothetical protein